MEAGNLKPGEHVVTLSGASGTATATVAWVHVVAGRADMYNLTVASDHTYAVGDGGVVVHNVCLPDNPAADANDTAHLLGKSVREVTGEDSPTVGVAWATDEAGNAYRLISVNEDAFFRLNVNRDMLGLNSDDTVFVEPFETPSGHAHAEYYLDQYMQANNLQLKGLGASTRICPGCAQMLVNSWGPDVPDLIGIPFKRLP